MKAKSIEKVLVTDGAGFVGSHTADLLIKQGYHVTILDNLEPQVHGKERKLPDYINKNAVFIDGNVLDYQQKQNNTTCNDNNERVCTLQSVNSILSMIRINIGKQCLTKAPKFNQPT